MKMHDQPESWSTTCTINQIKSNQNCERGWNNRSRYKVHESEVDMRQLQQTVWE